MAVMPGMIRTGRGIKEGRQCNFPFCYPGPSSPLGTLEISGDPSEKVKDGCPIKNVGYDNWSPSFPTPPSVIPAGSKRGSIPLPVHFSRFTSPEDGCPLTNVGHDAKKGESDGFPFPRE